MHHRIRSKLSYIITKNFRIPSLMSCYVWTSE